MLQRLMSSTEKVGDAGSRQPYSVRSHLFARLLNVSPLDLRQTAPQNTPIRVKCCVYVACTHLRSPSGSSRCPPTSRGNPE